jgi:hypothetical protein
MKGIVMENVKKHWMITLVLFFSISSLFTFVLVKDNIAIRIEEFRFSEKGSDIESKRILYNYHRVSDNESGMTQFIDAPQSPVEERTPQEPSKKFIYHKVQQGDTLWKIAHYYNIAIDEIILHNDIKNPDLIYQGSMLKILTSS